MEIVKKLFILWLIISLFFWLFTAPFIALGVTISALSTYLIWLTRRPISSVIRTIRISTKWKFVIIGSLGALWVETEFWSDTLARYNNKYRAWANFPEDPGLN